MVTWEEFCKKESFGVWSGVLWEWEVSVKIGFWGPRGAGGVVFTVRQPVAVRLFEGGNVCVCLHVCVFVM